MGNKYTPLAKYDDIPGSLPTAPLPSSFDVNVLAKKAVEQLNNLQKEHLADNATWRDILSFTDTFRTFQSPVTVYDTLQKLSRSRKRSSFTSTAAEPRTIQAPGDANWIDIDLTFTVEDGDLHSNCAGTVSITPTASGEWKIWMLRTWLENYDGHGHPDQPNPKVVSGETNGTTNGQAGDADEHIYEAIVVGGGQAGLGAAGRLKALALEYILFDERPKIGDSWGHRYDSAKWHTTRELGHLPFGRTFTEDDPDLLPIKRIGSAFKEWSEKHSINAQEATRVERARWDGSTKLWTVHTSGTDGDQQWKSRNLISGMGVGCTEPNYPDWATPSKIAESNFKGTVVHSANYHNVNAFANKPGSRGIVIGSANTAHDIAEDMANAGMHTTMVQRNPTFVLPGEWLVAINNAEYTRDKPTEVSDRQHFTQPLKILREMANRGIHMGIKYSPDRFDALEKAGFKLDRYGDLFENITIRLGGHYVDIGNCERIVKGEVKMKGEAVECLTERGLRFVDGSELEANIIVLCTGFDRDYRKAAAAIVGEEVAEQMDEYGGPDKEGEIRGMAKVAGHPHLFYLGGDVRSARFLSRFVALQLQKRKLGGKLEPYLEDK